MGMALKMRELKKNGRLPKNSFSKFTNAACAIILCAFFKVTYRELARILTITATSLQCDELRK